MTGIFPSTNAGGVVVRDTNGNAINPPNAPVNVHRPAVAFEMTGPQTAHAPTSCPLPPEPGQMNAISSEILAFAEALNPEGMWDIAAVGNLAASFIAWRDGLGVGSLREAAREAIDLPGLQADVAAEVAIAAAHAAAAAASAAAASNTAFGVMAANTVKANLTGAVAPPADATAAQVRAFLSLGIADVSGLATALAAKYEQYSSPSFVTVTAGPPGSGAIQMAGGGGTNAGYIGFYNASSVRTGYLGFAPIAGGRHLIVAEHNSTGYQFNTVPYVNSDPMLTSANFATLFPQYAYHGQLITSLSANDYIGQGWYIGYNVTGAPSGGTDWYGFKNYSLNSSWVVQDAFALATATNNGKQFRRFRQSDVWGAWSDITPIVTAESAEISVPASTSTTWAHGLGSKPRMIGARLRCKTAEGGYAVGDEIHLSSQDFYNLGNLTFCADATNVTLSVRASMRLGTKDGTNAFTPTNANWRVVFLAMR